MSIVFVPQKLRGTAKINQETIQRLLDENDQFIRCIVEYMHKGRAVECVKYQQFLHRNIVYLATLADASPPDNVSSSSSSWPCDQSSTSMQPSANTNEES
ncbi:SS18-like protein 2 [Syngnathus scovelli]|uniref:SS18-like protein 2 n=1 Tax=Syngnathus scovelli TaxID=161590 RepID=UPI00210F2AF9|nr:SS18-like protein 2 [Syngnathus scovelli]